MTSKFIITALLFVISIAHADVIKQPKLDFPVQAEKLMKGDSHYFFKIISPKKLTNQYPELAKVDTLSLLKNKDTKLVISKSVSIVNKPVGFFDDKQLSDEKYVAHVHESNRTKKTGPEAFLVTVPGGQTYRMHLYFDADDISTLPNSKVVKAVAAAKKLDVISQGASTTMVVERNGFQEDLYGGVSVSSYIPMKENKTLIITYSLWALRKPFLKSSALEKNFQSEIESVKKLIENYKVD